MFTLENIKKLTMNELKDILLENTDLINKDIDGLGGVIFEYAVWWKNYHLIFFLLDNFEIDLFRKDRDGETVLFTAISHRSLKLIKLLLDRGLVITEKDNNGESILHHLIGHIAIGCPEKKDIALIKFLVDNGLDVNEKNNDGETPLSLAKGAVTQRCDNNTSIVELLSELSYPTVPIDNPSKK